MKAIEKLETTGRKSWLASVGAYGESLEKATNKLDKLYVDGNALVNDLVARGETVEAELKGRINAKLKGKTMFEDKIAMLKNKLGMNSEGRDVQLERLSSKVDNLIEVVAKLAQQKAAEKKSEDTKAAPKVTPARKTPAKTAAKPAVAKAESSTTTKAPASAKAAPAKKAPAKPRARKTTAAKPAGDKA